MSRPRSSKSTQPIAEHPTAAPAPASLRAPKVSQVVKNSSAEHSWVVPEELNKRPVDGALKALAGVPWSDARSAILTGKVRVGGETVLDLLRYVYTGNVISLHPAAPKPRTTQVKALDRDLIVYVDSEVVVVRKPAGISTVPFGDEEREEITLDALVRDVLSRRDRIRGRAELGVVQRLDKVTSGILVFARTFAAKKHLGQQLRDHSMHRRYLAIAHGDVQGGTFRTYLVEDAGRGLRGSAASGRREGQLAVTHVTSVRRLNGATLVSCQLETGRTHQIRIHLSEAGHPLVGEKVYIRNYRGGEPISAPRLMLHAAELGFAHPSDDRPMSFVDEPPQDFQEVLNRLGA
jgi:23S rRNA pseudouridine1911/1915/1917 synthase